MAVDLVIKNGDVLIPSGLTRAGVAVDDGKIVLIAKEALLPQADKVVDASGKIVLPGVIDTHVHFRDPGFTYKEDYETGSKAAAKGGVTMVVDMPNTDPPPNTLQRYLEHRDIAKRKSYVDFNSWAMPTVLEEVPKINDAGNVGYKFFMKLAHYPYGPAWCITKDDEILKVFKEVAKTGKPCLVHPHAQDLYEYRVKEQTESGDIKGVQAYSDLQYSYNGLITSTAIARLVLMADATGVKLRLLHFGFGGPGEVRLLKALRAAGYRFLTELSAWGVFRVWPALGGQREIDEWYWSALNDGTVDVVATDHAPHTKEEHDRGYVNIFDSVLFSFPFVETFVSQFLTEVNNGRISLQRLSQLVSESVAKHLGIYPQKGVIQLGSDADFTIVDLKKEGVIRSEELLSKAAFTPFHGNKVKGMPTHTIVRGAVIMEDGQVVGKPGFGEFTPPVGPPLIP